MRNLKVVPVEVCGMSGWQIQGIDRACSDSLWEVIAHAAIFRDESRAERFLEKVCRKSSWEYDWKYWGVPCGSRVSPADAFQSHVAPFSVI
jgi:hypothetical protein